MEVDHPDHIRMHISDMEEKEFPHTSDEEGEIESSLEDSGDEYEDLQDSDQEALDDGNLDGMSCADTVSNADTIYDDRVVSLNRKGTKKDKVGAKASDLSQDFKHLQENPAFKDDVRNLVMNEIRSGNGNIGKVHKQKKSRETKGSEECSGTNQGKIYARKIR